ncbi:MAG: hypothetical protein U0165_16195 [Polyangiaceae bacterium]
MLMVAKDAGLPERVIPIARQRVVEGPIRDALICVTLIGGGAELTLPSYNEARARLQLLLWEAGASALEVPELARWIWSSPDTFEEIIERPAHGSLRDRAVVARCLEITAQGIPSDISKEIQGRTLKLLQPLLFHPEPLVWIHGARALGRLTGPIPELVDPIFDWVQGDSAVIRQRAITAFACFPADRLGFLSSHLSTVIRAPVADPFSFAAVAAATPYLFYERRDLWDRLATRILAGDGGAVAARALAKGLATLRRRGTFEPAVESTMRQIREMARRARPSSLDESRRWIEVIAVTDVIDSAERDPLDLELGIENLVRVAAQYDDEEADARAARFAGSLSTTFQSPTYRARHEQRASSRRGRMHSKVAPGRSSLRLWSPMLATRPGGVPVEERTSRRHGESSLVRRPIFSTSSKSESKPRTRPTRPPCRSRCSPFDWAGMRSMQAPRTTTSAQDAAQRPTTPACGYAKSKGCSMAHGSSPSLAEALSSLFWRLIDTTQGTALGEVDDARWLGPFAAWWALVIDRPTVLLSLATALPILSLDALKQCCQDATELRAALDAGEPDGQWGEAVAVAFAALHAQDTELAQAVLLLADSLEAFAAAGGRNPDLDAICLDLVLARKRVQRALANPVAALHAVGESDDGAERGEARQRERASRCDAGRTRDSSTRAVDARRVVRIVGPCRVGVARECDSWRDPSHHAASAHTEESPRSD